MARVALLQEVTRCGTFNALFSVECFFANRAGIPRMIVLSGQMLVESNERIDARHT